MNTQFLKVQLINSLDVDKYVYSMYVYVCVYTYKCVCVCVYNGTTLKE